MGLYDAIGNVLSGLGQMYESSRDRAAQAAMAQQNIDLQKEFAQHGISWKVADARAAGISPLAAMGANTYSFSPVYLGGERRGLGQIGKGIGQGLDYMDQQLKRLIVQEKMEDVKRKWIENQQLMGGQSDVDGYGLAQGNVSVSFPKGASDPNNWSAPGTQLNKSQIPMQWEGGQAGILPFEAYYRNRKGYVVLRPSPQVTELLEDSLPDKYKYFLDRAKWFHQSIKNYKNYETSEAKLHREWLRKVRPPMIKQYVGKREWRYNPWEGWILTVKKNFRDSYLYEDRRGGFRYDFD